MWPPPRGRWEGMLLLNENHTPLEDQTVRYCMSLAMTARKSGCGS